MKARWSIKLLHALGLLCLWLVLGFCVLGGTIAWSPFMHAGVACGIGSVVLWELALAKDRDTPWVTLIRIGQYAPALITVPVILTHTQSPWGVILIPCLPIVLLAALCAFGACIGLCRSKSAGAVSAWFAATAGLSALGSIAYAAFSFLVA